MVHDQMLVIVTPEWSPGIDVLRAMEADLNELMQRAGCVHFASLALLPPRPGAKAGTAPSLMLELAVDDGLTPTRTLDLLLKHGESVLWSLYGAHRKAPPPAADAAARTAWLRGFLLGHVHRAIGGYVGSRDRSVAQIRAEGELLHRVRDVQRYLKALPDERDVLASQTADWVHRVHGNDGPAPRSFWRTPRGRAIARVVMVFVVALLLPFALLRRLGRRLDRPDMRAEVPRAHQVHPSVEACEARLLGRPSHMLSLTEVRWPYWWNALWLRLFLLAITWLGHVFFTEGRLGSASGIRMSHWHVFDGNRRLLFCANFDGAFGGYLDEFINGGTPGTNLFWRWTELLPRRAAADAHPAVVQARRFPDTALLVLRGCRHEQWFKAYARDSMLPHLWRFEAYRYSATEVERATRLRDALHAERSAVNDDRILRAIES